jgi:diguanylate cyclase (GGDEF)-like protein
MERTTATSAWEATAPRTHPRTIGWLGTTALAMGGSNQSLFLIGALILGQGSAAVPLLVLGLLLSWAAAPGWTELILLWPDRVGGIASCCAEAFRPYSPVLANLTGVCYWWGWVPTCGLTAILSATAITDWFLPGLSVPLLASVLVLAFTAINLCGVRWVTRLALPVACASAVLAFLSGFIPVITGHVDWHRATTYHLATPFSGIFGGITSAMAGLYLIGFAAPAFEAAACHVGETVDPSRNVPRAMLASAAMAGLYFLILPVIWLGALGPAPLTGDLAHTLGPTFAPLLGATGRACAIWFLMFNMFHGTLQPLAGAARTLLQLAEDGLLPRVLARRNRYDAPWVATALTAGMAILFLLSGDPLWVIAAANLCYLIGIALPNVAVWLLRKDAPTLPRPYRAPRGFIGIGLLAAGAWGLATVLGFEQYGLPTVLASMALAYSGVALYAWRRWSDRRRAGTSAPFWRSLHLKLTGAMLLVLGLDGVGYLLAVQSVGRTQGARITVLEDIFVAVALLTITVGLVLTGMIGHAVGEVARAADRLATGTLADVSRAMQALGAGDLDAARARVDMVPVVVHSRDELGAMAQSFNTMQDEIAQAARALDQARDDMRAKRDALRANYKELARWGAELERRVAERTAELQRAHDELASLATTDPLTGLPNHRAMMAALDHELERSRRYARPFAVLFLDLDHFKALNDSYGHQLGDAALRELAGVLRATLRGGDLVGRWGGEEFAALLPEADRAQALAIAERLRAVIAAHAFAVGGGAHLTASIGLAAYPADAEGRDGLVEWADRAMYAAKRLGRNQVRLSNDPAVAAQQLEVEGGSSREEMALAGTVEALAALVEARDQYTGQHTHEVATLTMRLALSLGLDASEARIVGLAGRLHDVGKVMIPDAILQKPAPLTEEEWALMRTHPQVGTDVVGRVPALRGLGPLIRGHHERWDGQGYPDGLAGAAIPLGARIIAVADAYGAITTDRPYRRAQDVAWALAELERCAGTQFDPAVTAALREVVGADPTLRERTEAPSGAVGPAITAAPSLRDDAARSR